MPRLFTLDEANALLPRLREILSDMQTIKPEIDRLRVELEALARQASSNGHLLGRALQRKREEAERLVERLNGLNEELAGLGCELKGLDEGLIDFPSERDGRVIYLCWKLGEERIGYWHEVSTGFAGRQPL